MTRKSTTEEFISKAIKVHGDRYGYDAVVYTGNKNKVLISCDVHGMFRQTPNNHITSNGCNKCGIMNTTTTNTKSTEQFIIEARNIHGNRFNYDKVKYQSQNRKVIINCSIHGDFNQQPIYHLMGSMGCVGCEAGAKTISFQEFVSRSRKQHGDKYLYPLRGYKGISIKVQITCPIHGIFLQYGTDHINGCGCPACSGVKQKTTDEFINDAIMVHGDRYDYSKVVYNNARKSVEIICKKHGSFWQRPNNHISSKSGCSECAYSHGHKVYIITFNFPTTSFIKIGIMKDTIGKRFVGHTKRCIIDTHRVYEFEDSSSALLAEKHLLNFSQNFSVVPPVLYEWGIGGYTECRTLPSLTSVLVEGDKLYD
jgi:hypothetical protein